MSYAVDIQEAVDAFYHAAGRPCCAGCDWWRHLNSVAGLCTLSPPIPGGERGAMLGLHGSSLNPGAGHAMTPRGHLCGQFRDAFDWRSLPPAYLRRIGFNGDPQ